MKQLPSMVVSLIHIQGTEPEGGKELVFTEFPITIGRLPHLNVRFPKDFDVISRSHAQIVREGNRFKLVDDSGNGTYVNGKLFHKDEILLKNGDILQFAEGGPKLSFLSEAREGVSDPLKAAPETAPPVQAPAPRPDRSVLDDPPLKPPPEEEPVTREPLQRSVSQEDEEPVLRPPGGYPPTEEVAIEPVKVPLDVLYGPNLHHFEELPVTIGKRPGEIDSRKHLVLDHPRILDRHAQIFFFRDEYWVKDLTGQEHVSIDGVPVKYHKPLRPEGRLALTIKGPVFQFKSGGRLISMGEPMVEEEPVPHEPERPPSPDPGGSGMKKGRSGFGKLFSKK